MPVQYPSGIRVEYNSVREDVGMFDVSHMGQLRLKGSKSRDFLQKMLINDINKLKVGDAQYTAMCNNEGGIIDDMILYKEKDSYLLVVNASNIDKNYNWLKKHNKNKNVILINESDIYSLIAIQGPNSRKILEKILSKKLSNKFGLISFNFGRTSILI